MKRTIPVILLILALILGVCGYIRHQDTTKTAPPTVNPTATAESSPEPTANPLLPADINSILNSASTAPIDTLPDSYTVLVNRDYLLPSDYVPKDLTEPKVRFSHSEHDDKRKLRKTAARALKRCFAPPRKSICFCTACPDPAPTSGRKVFTVGIYRSTAKNQPTPYPQNRAAANTRADSPLTFPPIRLTACSASASPAQKKENGLPQTLINTDISSAIQKGKQKLPVTLSSRGISDM